MMIGKLFAYAATAAAVALTLATTAYGGTALADGNGNGNGAVTGSAGPDGCSANTTGGLVAALLGKGGSCPPTGSPLG